MAHERKARPTKKSKLICIKFFLYSQNDKRELEKLAKIESRKVSDYVRQLVLAAIEERKSLAAERQLGEGINL